MDYLNEKRMLESVDSEAVLKGLEIATKEDVDFLFQLGDLFVQKKRFTSAKRVYHKITRVMPESSFAWFKEGTTLDDLERFDAAILCYDRAIELNRNFFEAHSNKGIALAKLGRYSDAIRSYDQALRINENDPSVLYNKGRTFNDLGKYNEAIKYFDKSLERSNIKSEAHLEALLSKGVSLSKIGKYDDALESNNKALRIYPENWKLWLNQGIAFGKLKRYKEEIKCYNKALKINQELVAALSNKGTALTNIGKLYKTKYPEKACKYFNIAYKFIDKALELSPNSTNVQLSKGVILGELDKIDEALECYEKVISKSENFPEAYGNRGILFLNAHKYEDAERELKIAKELFLKMNRKKDAEIADNCIFLAINARDMIHHLKPIDQKFISCLNNKSLTKLKEDISSISGSMTAVVSDFMKRKLPDDAKELLISKETCINALLNALELQQVDFKKLEECRIVFGKWELDDYNIAVNSLDSFIRYSHKIQKKFSCIPSEEEPILLSFLKNVCVLDGNLTRDISEKFKGESFIPKPIEITGPRIINIPIPIDIKDNFVRIGIVQLMYTLTETFPYKLENKDQIKQKILNALEIADREGANILCFPELCFLEEFIEEIRKYEDLIIIGGSFYRDNFNICPVLMGGEEYDVFKINPSPNYETEVIPKKFMKPGNDIKVFFSAKNNFRFVVLICWDYIIESNKLYLYDNGHSSINFIFNPSYNPDKDRFQRKADSDCENYHIDLVQVNAKTFGGSCIIGIENKNVIHRLKLEGCRQKDNFVYKLCEANGEMMIFSDLELNGIEVPSSVGSKPRIRIKGCYTYENDSWKETKSPWWID